MPGEGLLNGASKLGSTLFRLIDFFFRDKYCGHVSYFSSCCVWYGGKFERFGIGIVNEKEKKK